MTNIGLGFKIKELRNKNRMTQGKLGELLNVSQVAVSKWEKQQTEPDATSLKKIANIFDVSIDFLLGNSYDSTPRKYLIHKEMINEEIIMNVPVIKMNNNYPTIINENNDLEYKAVTPLEMGEYDKTNLLYVRAKDDSMIDEHIAKDSLILVNLQTELRDGDIGVFQIKNTQDLIIRKYHTQGNYIILKLANKYIEEKDTIFTTDDLNKEFLIVGKGIKVEFYI